MEHSALSPNNNQMAADRTWLALQRTLMAWVRTATSMIGFGFTIYKFFEERPPRPSAILTSRDFAILMIGFGIVALILASVQHELDVRTLKGLTSRKRLSISLVLSLLVAFLGAVAFVAAILRE